MDGQIGGFPGIAVDGLRAHLESALQQRPAPSVVDRTPLVFLGSGSLYAQAFIEFGLSHLKVVACIDNLRAGQRQGDLEVVTDAAIPDLLRRHPDAVGVLCCQSDNAVTHFHRVWQASGRPLVNMFELMRDSGFDAGPTYYADFQDLAQLSQIYQDCWPRFADEDSQRSFLSVLLFRATLAQHWLEGVRLPYEDMYFFTSGLAISSDEVLVDAGSFDGDTLVQFLRRVGGGYRHIHALEPDPLNFAQLQRNFGQLDRSTLHACGLWSEGTLADFQLGGLGSHLAGGEGGVPVRLEALDAMDLGPVSLLKMDIEGAEVPALQGARRTIERDKPKLAIAAYHKADDIPRLIETVSAIRDDYRFTLRHHSPFFRDTVLMAY